MKKKRIAVLLSAVMLMTSTLMGCQSGTKAGIYRSAADGRQHDTVDCERKGTGNLEIFLVGW